MTKKDTSKFEIPDKRKPGRPKKAEADKKVRIPKRDPNLPVGEANKIYREKIAVKSSKNNNPESIAARQRFLSAVQYIISSGQASNLTAVALTINVRYTFLHQFKTNFEKVAMDVVYYSRLVEKYNISAHWLLTGQGEMVNE
jgi:hypothetical protein